MRTTVNNNAVMVFIITRSLLMILCGNFNVSFNDYNISNPCAVGGRNDIQIGLT